MTKYKNILLIEDDADDKEVFIEVLRRIDPEVVCTTAYNGSYALQMLQISDPLPDLIFLDLNMPRMDGFELLGLIGKDARLKQIPVIILTTSTSDAKQCCKLGACLYITKPESLIAFRRMLSTILSHDVANDASLLQTLLSAQDPHQER